MSNDAFESAVELVLSHEGGYSNDPSDPGGETNFGISKRTYPAEDIKNLTRDRAKDIYYRDFWLPIQGFDLPPPVATILFDMAVNMGKHAAVTCLQQALNVSADGWVGPITKEAVKAWDEKMLAKELTVRRIMRYTERDRFPTFGLGWVRRSIATLAAA